MARIFLDVGAHYGETAEVAVESTYAFDRVCCFEPSAKCFERLEILSKLYPSIEVYQFGLGNKNSLRWLQNSGELGGSFLYNEKTTSERAELTEVRDIVEWMEQSISEDDFVVMKINCEGGEVEIIERLLEAQKLSFFYTIVVSWDIREYRNLARQEVDLRTKLRALNCSNCCSSDDVMLGETHSDRVKHWLNLFGVHKSEISRDVLRREHIATFLHYAKKTGSLQRFECRVKQAINYNALPKTIKYCLRFFKRLVRMNRDRKINFDQSLMKVSKGSNTSSEKWNM